MGKTIWVISKIGSYSTPTFAFKTKESAEHFLKLLDEKFFATARIEEIELMPEFAKPAQVAEVKFVPELNFDGMPEIDPDDFPASEQDYGTSFLDPDYV